MKLPEMLTAIRIELQDTNLAAALYTNAELIRAIEKSLSLMSRLMPKRVLESITVTEAMQTSDFIIDISSVLSEFIRIERIEHPIDDTPPAFPTYDIMDGKIIFRSDPAFTTDDTDIRIQYLKAWTPPSQTAIGDYPVHLDNGMIVGSVGQALNFKAEYYVKQAAAAILSITAIMTTLAALTLSNPTLTPPTAPVLGSPTAPTAYTFVKPTAPVLSAVPTAPASPSIATHITAAQTAMTAAIARFAAAVTALGSMTTPLGAATTALAAVITKVAASQTQLDAGDDFANKSTRGAEVMANYGKYGDIEVSQANAHNQEGAQRTAIALGWEAKAARENTIGNSYLNEAVQRLTIVARLLEEYEREVAAYTAEINGYSAESAALVNLFEAKAGIEHSGVENYAAQVQAYVAQLNANNALVAKFSEEVRNYQTEVAEAQADIAVYNAKVNNGISRADQLTKQSEAYMVVAGRYLASGTAKVQEFLALMGFKAEISYQKASAEQRA